MKWYKTDNMSLRMATYSWVKAIFFLLPPCTICVILKIFQAVVTKHSCSSRWLIIDRLLTLLFLLFLTLFTLLSIFSAHCNTWYSSQIKNLGCSLKNVRNALFKLWWNYELSSNTINYIICWALNKIIHVYNDSISPLCWQSLL